MNLIPLGRSVSSPLCTPLQSSNWLRTLYSNELKSSTRIYLPKTLIAAPRTERNIAERILREYTIIGTYIYTSLARLSAYGAANCYLTSTGAHTHDFGFNLNRFGKLY